MQLQGRMLFLLVALVLLIFIRPFFSEQSVLLGFFLAALLLGTLYAISRGDRRVFIIAVALGGPHVGAIWLGHLVLGNVGYLIGVVFGLLFYGFVAWILLTLYPASAHGDGRHALRSSLRLFLTGACLGHGIRTGGDAASGFAFDGSARPARLG